MRADIFFDFLILKQQDLFLKAVSDFDTNFNGKVSILCIKE